MTGIVATVACTSMIYMILQNTSNYSTSNVEITKTLVQQRDSLSSGTKFLAQQQPKQEWRNLNPPQCNVECKVSGILHFSSEGTLYLTMELPEYNYEVYYTSTNLTNSKLKWTRY